MKKFWTISFYGGIAGTAVFLLMAIGSLFTSELRAEAPVFLLGMLFYGIIPMSFGYYFRKRFLKAETDYKRMLVQRMMITLAKQNKGIVKISDVVLNLEISYEEAKALMDDASLAGMATAEVDEDGFIYYSFPEFRE